MTLDNLLIPVTNHQDLVFDPTRDYLYITTDDGNLERFDLNSQTLLPAIDVGQVLNGADITPDGNKLVIAEDIPSSTQGFVHILDLTDNSVSTEAYDLARGVFRNFEIGAWDISIDARGDRAWVTTDYPGSGWTPLRELDLITGEFTIRADPAPGPGGLGLRQNTRIHRSSDREFILFSESDSSAGPASIYSVSSDSFTVRVRTDAFLGNVAAVNRDGSIFAIENIRDLNLYDANLNLIQKLSGLDAGAIFSPIDDILYVIDDERDVIRTYDTNYWIELESFSIGEDIGRADSFFSYDQPLEITDDGDYLFVRTPSGIRILDTPEIDNRVIEGQVRNDIDGDGDLTDLDNGIAGVTLQLLSHDQELLQTTVTDAQGNYRFDRLVNGRYIIREIDPIDAVSTADSNGFNPNQVINLTLDSSSPQISGIDFLDTFPIIGTISGQVRNDLDGDGDLIDEDPGLENVTIELRDSRKTLIATTTTNAEGQYIFEGLSTGTYTVNEIDPQGVVSTADTNGFNPNRVTNIQLNSNTPNRGRIDFLDTLSIQGTISGQVRNDTDASGDFSELDLGIPGVTIQLRNANNRLLTSTTTDELGRYVFDELTPGNYIVNEVDPDNVVSITDVNGFNPNRVIGLNLNALTPNVSGVNFLDSIFDEEIPTREAMSS